MSVREYETGREEPQRLKLLKSTRDAGGRIDENDEGGPKVIVLRYKLDPWYSKNSLIKLRKGGEVIWESEILFQAVNVIFIGNCWHERI